MSEEQKIINIVLVSLIAANIIAWIAVAAYTGAVQPLPDTDSSYDFRGRDIINAGAYNSVIPGVTEGPVGPVGPVGPPGPIGPSGGEQGIQGIQGIPGIEGDKGETGSQGVAGPAGSTGAQGNTGPTGPVDPGLPAEITNRTNADTDLGVRIDTLRGSNTNPSSLTTLTTGLATEYAARVSGDSSRPWIIYSIPDTRLLTVTNNGNNWIDEFVQNGTSAATNATIGSLDVPVPSSGRIPKDTTWRFDVKGRLKTTGAYRDIRLHAQVVQSNITTNLTQSTTNDDNSEQANPGAAQWRHYHLVCDMRLNYGGHEGRLGVFMHMNMIGGSSSSGFYTAGASSSAGRMNMAIAFKVNIGFLWDSDAGTKDMRIDSCTVTQCDR